MFETMNFTPRVTSLSSLRLRIRSGVWRVDFTRMIVPGSPKDTVNSKPLETKTGHSPETPKGIEYDRQKVFVGV